MTEPQAEARREFLLRLARSSVFLPPLILSADVRPAAARQGKGKGGGPPGKGGDDDDDETTGGLTPTSSGQTAPAQTPTLPDAPWGQRSPGATPPWSRPPGGSEEEEQD